MYDIWYLPQHLSYSTILPHSFLWHIEEGTALFALPPGSIYKKRTNFYLFLFSRYCRFLARYSGLVLVSISTLSVIAIICSLTLHQLPDFTDPQAVSDRYKESKIRFCFKRKRKCWVPTDLKFNLPFLFTIVYQQIELLHWLSEDTYHGNPLFLEASDAYYLLFMLFSLWL